MFLKSRIFRAISIFCIIFSMTLLTFADTIRLKDGSIIKGKIVGFTGGKFTVLIDDGSRQKTLNFTAEEIESITFDSTSMPVSNTEPLERTPPTIKTEGNSTIITVGQKNPQNTGNSNGNTTIPPIDTTPTDINNSDEPTNEVPNSTVITTKPITIKIPVLADDTANGWTNSGWVVRKGQKIKIKGSGRVALGNGRYATPNGISTLPDENKLMKDNPTGSLIAVIGADNNEFIFVGDSIEFVASRDGDLFLGVNEGNLSDNSGSFEVVIEIDPNLSN